MPFDEKKTPYSYLDKDKFNDFKNEHNLYKGDTVTYNDSEGEEEEEEEEGESDSEEGGEEEEGEFDSDEETLYTEGDEEIIEKLHIFEQMFETFLKPIGTFFNKINYSNIFIQIIIIVSIVYIISSIISMIHINVDYKLPP
tara:strand:- start:361 stop:783 length:423 start_codon:yes stop_codon:yes gene_type:complete